MWTRSEEEEEGEERIHLDGSKNTAKMKMSFSLSSLQPSSGSLERAEHAEIRADRPYNSLTKKRKEPMQDQGTKNWSGPEDSKDDFWAAIRTNYDYIMDTNLIDTCKEANGELAWDEGDVSTVSWGLKEVSCQFSELYSWLRVLQELVYSKEENLLDKSLRVAHTEELRRKAYRRRLFNEQAEKLIARAPSLKEEVSWRVDHLNAKWDLVEQIMSPVQRPDELDNQDVSADFEHEVKCLRKWLREMEARLQPLNFRVDWSRTEIEEKAMEHMVLQRDIESHGRIVSSVVKLGERVAGRNQCSDQEPANEHQQQQLQALRIASSLERRWHLLFLRSLEWQCHIEALAARVRTKLSASRCSSDSDDEEPVTKQPRLSRRASTPLIHSSSSSTSSCPSSSSSSQDESSSGTSTRRRSSVRARRQLRARPSQEQQHQSEASESHASKGPVATSSDSDVSSENRFIDDGSYFEDDLDVLCVVNTQIEDLQNQTKLYTDKRRTRNAFGDQGTEADIEEADLSEEEIDNIKQNANMPPSPNPLQTPIDESRDEIDLGVDDLMVTKNELRSSDGSKRRKTEIEETDVFNTSNRKSKNCATFYFKHTDTDSDNDRINRRRRYQADHQSEDIVVDESSEEEWTYTSARMDEQIRFSSNDSAKMCLYFDTASSSSEKNGSGTENDAMITNVADEIDEANMTREARQAERNNNSDYDIKSRRSIQRLIEEVEKLVRQEGKEKLPPSLFDDKKGLLSSLQHNKAKYARVKEWLALNSVLTPEDRCTSETRLLAASEALDSCDASGEYTTGESDVEKQSEISEEDMHSSVVTCRLFSQSNSEELLEDVQIPSKERSPVPQKSAETSTPKVVMRSKCKSHNGPRPWSVSCITQIENCAILEINTQETISQHSISETALHQLIAGPPAKSASLDATESRAPFNNSASTLLEVTVIGHDARVVRNSSLRRKKNRLRKKNVSRRSESGSDGVNAATQRSEGSDEVSSGNNPRSTRKSISSGSRQTRSSRSALNVSTTNLVKSCSFSGYGAMGESEIIRRTNNSDKLKTTASSESEEDQEELACRAVQRSARTRTNIEESMSVEKPEKKLNDGDSDIEKISFGTNSISEQAWDFYQENYMSEAYSEAFDTEGARRLLEYNDDYRNFLDSQSDCASSVNAAHGVGRITSDDSDSDSEFRRLIETSRRRLLVSEARYGSITDSSFVRTEPSDYEELKKHLRDLLITLKRIIRKAIRKLLTSLSNHLVKFGKGVCKLASIGSAILFSPFRLLAIFKVSS